MDSLSETLDTALDIVKPSESKISQDRDETNAKAEVKENHKPELTASEQDSESHLNDDQQCKTNVYKDNQTVLLDSQENIQKLSLDENSNTSKETSLENETKSDLMHVQDSDKITDMEKDSTKHVSFNINQNSNPDDLTFEEESDFSDHQNNMKYSDHKDQLEETKRDNSSPAQLKDNAFNAEPEPAVSENNSVLKTEQELTDKGSALKVKQESMVTETDSALKKDHEVTVDSFVSDSSTSIDAEMSEEELQDLHVRVDIFRFLLPGLCHLTSEDIPRLVLIQEGILALLDLYMWRQWNLFTQNPQSREVQVRFLYYIYAEHLAR